MRQFAATSDTGFPAITTTSSNKSKKHKSSAGKVLLAAIVHHDTLNELVANQSTECHPNYNQKLVNDKTKATSSSNNKSDKFEVRDVEKSNSRSKNSRKVEVGVEGNQVEERNKQTECIGFIGTETSSTPIKSKIKAAINGCYTHNFERKQESSTIMASSNGGRKFSKLFSKKKKTQVTKTLIDNAQTNGYPPSAESSNFKKDQQLHQIPPTKINERENQQFNQVAYQQREQVDKQQINVLEAHQASNYEKIFETDKEQVIEFKFDLIVNKESCETNETTTIPTVNTTRDQKKQSNCYDFYHDNDVNYNADLDKESKLMNCKLDDNINELVESFVLDSSDVCFMSTGRQSSKKLAALHNPQVSASELAADTSFCDEFDYLNKLLLHTLNYSFQLLEVKKRRRRNTIVKLGNNNSQSNDELANLFINNTEPNFEDLITNGHNKYPSTESYSIEISATLFLNRNSSHNLHLRGVKTETGSSDNCADHDERLQTPTQETLSNYYILDLLSNDEIYSKQLDELVPSSLHKTQKINQILAELNCDSENKEPAKQKPFVDNPQEASRRVNSAMNEQISIDCANIEEGLKVMERIRNRLGQFERNLKVNTGKQQKTNRESSSATASSDSYAKSTTVDNKLLIIGLKLKEKIDSGLFSNRMCLIDFDPNFIEMHSIFESIFSGQALAYLKRHKLHLKKLESKFKGLVSDLIDLTNATSIITSTGGNGTKSNLNFVNGSYFKDDDDLEKQHHQVASQSKLIQAEWILYKQLSSALIRTLMIVHVHRLANTIPSTITNTNNIDGNDSGIRDECGEYYEHYLMKKNLIALKFARSIQRASAIRLKRRKRHLKSHLASSNASVASNASATTTTNDILNSLSMNDQEETSHFDYYTTTTIGDCYSPHFYQNEPGCLISTDSTSNLANPNHHHGKRRIHDRSRQQYLRYLSQNGCTNNNRHRAEPISQLKAFQYSCQRSDFATTESSSMSTSSGSRTRQIRSSRSSRKRDSNLRDNSINNFSDSDSITSTNLNSCSSASFNRPQNSFLSNNNSLHRNYNRNNHDQRHQHRSSSKPRRLKRDIELKWIAKQSSSRPVMQEQQLLHHHYDKQAATQSPSHIELSDFKMSSTQRSLSVSRVMTAPRNSSQVIQIDCSPSNTDNNLSSLSLQHLDENSNSRTLVNSGDTTLIGVEDNTDNVSDICSIVAEPPKQLKLEEFLNQLSSIIAPSSKITGIIQDKSIQNKTLVESSNKIQNEKKDFQGEASVPNSGREELRNLTEMMCRNRSMAQQQMATNRFEPDVDNNSTHSSNDLDAIKQGDTLDVQANQNNDTNTEVNEDDEDCKSHSSILEQLSSLVLESNSRLNYRNQHQHDNSHVSEREQHKLSHVSNRNNPQEHFVLQPLDCPLDNSSVDILSCRQQLNSQQASKIPKTTGHLQRILYNSSQSPRKVARSRVTVRDPSSVEERLRALSVSCQAPPASPPTSSSGAFTLSTDSSCSSSSSFVENNIKRGTIQPNDSESPLENRSGIMDERNLYASVTRGHQKVNI